MKVLLICPGDCFTVTSLSEQAPLANLPLMGTSFIARWMEHLAATGFKDVRVLAVDRPDEVRAEVGNGARWGLQVEIVTNSPQDREIIQADHLPGVPNDKVFASYANFFRALTKSLRHIKPGQRIGARQIKPGVWLGLRSSIDPDAIVNGPCWIGENVHIEKNAYIGANTIIEDGAWIAEGAEASESVVGCETHLGAAAKLDQSIAMGETLINWQRNSVTKVADNFLLCSLRTAPWRDRAGQWAAHLMTFAKGEPRGLRARAMALRGTIV